MFDDSSPTYDQEFADGVFGELADAVAEPVDEAIDDGGAGAHGDVAPPELPISDEFATAMQTVDGDGDSAADETPDDGAALEALGSITLQEIEKRRGLHPPILAPKKIDPRFRQWQVDSGQVFGPAGGETTITIRPNCRFRSEKIMATDDSATPGRGTRVLSVTIGTRVQKVGGHLGTLTAFFAAQALGNGIEFDTANPWSSIQIRVLFVAQCNFEMTIFGTAEIGEE